MKKILISLGTVLLGLVISFSIFNKLRQDEMIPGAEPATEVTLQPILTTIPTVTPEPTITPELLDNSMLYPAFQRIDGTKKYGFINEAGEFVISPSYDTASDFKDGVAVVSKENLYGIIDTKGTLLYEGDVYIEDFHNGVAVFAKYIGDLYQFGYIDNTGTIIITPQYQIATDFGEDSTAYVSMNDGTYAKIDKQGNILESYELSEQYRYPVSIKDGYIIYSNPEINKYGVIRFNGDTILEPVYSEITYLGRDLFAVKDPKIEYFDVLSTSPVAIFNHQGEQLTDYMLFDINEYTGDYSSATDSNSTFFIGLEGAKVTTLPSYEGRGKITMFGDIIKAEIDQDLIYSKKDGTLLWQSNNSYTLPNGLIVTSIKAKPNKYVTIYYPQLEGFTNANVQLSVNDELRRLFTESRMELKEEDLLSVEDNFNAELLSQVIIINRYGYDYPFGAAHGMPILDYYYIDSTTGEFYELADLFVAGSDYKNVLNKIITTEIEKQSKDEASMLFPEFFTGIIDHTNFKITPEALIIYFYPYEIAAYAAGFPEFTIPFEDITEYIDTDGAFWNSFH
jgi:hypothetical protein